MTVVTVTSFVASTRIEDDPLRADEIQADAAHGRQGVAYLLAVIACHSDILLPLATIRIEADPAPESDLRRKMVLSRSNPRELKVTGCFMSRAN